jgi:hypothetical protein|tara:strand:+ start:688 stop:1035 length:348 start_codon:yes stop_codon:yes gene_type:complete
LERKQSTTASTGAAAATIAGVFLGIAGSPVRRQSGLRSIQQQFATYYTARLTNKIQWQYVSATIVFFGFTTCLVATLFSFAVPSGFVSIATKSKIYATIPRSKNDGIHRSLATVQ